MYLISLGTLQEGHMNLLYLDDFIKNTQTSTRVEAFQSISPQVYWKLCKCVRWPLTSVCNWWWPRVCGWAARRELLHHNNHWSWWWWSDRRCWHPRWSHHTETTHTHKKPWNALNSLRKSEEVIDPTETLTMSRLRRVPLSCLLKKKNLEMDSDPTTRTHNFPELFSGHRGRHCSTTITEKRYKNNNNMNRTATMTTTTLYWLLATLVKTSNKSPVCRSTKVQIHYRVLRSFPPAVARFVFFSNMKYKKIFVE